MKHIFLIVLVVLAGRNKALSLDEEDSRLPRLFHLDDHDRCLLQPNGIYCLGEFDLVSVGPSQTYENIKKHNSKYPDGFNRSRLYRGYCISARCPAGENNASLRFEQCVDKNAQMRYALSARLRNLQYCKTQQDYAARAQKPASSTQQLFLQVVYAILALNFIGTIYDVATGNDTKNGIISAWSVRASWRRLTAVYDEGDPRLKQLEPIQGMRVVAMLLFVYAHISVLHYQFYVTNPSFLDTLFSRVDGIIMAQGTSLVQIFVIISTFLTAYNLTLYSEKHQLSMIMVPKLIIKRIIRILPVHLLVVGFIAAYGHPFLSDVFSSISEQSMESCRRKFWAHTFFANTIMFKNDNDCLVTSWFLPVDMHLFILTSVLTIYMHRRRHQAFRLYVALFLLSSVGCGILGYAMGYRPFIIESVPEKIRGLFKNSTSFGGFYVSTWASASACFLGLILAHQQYELRNAKHAWNQNQWLRRLLPWTVPFGAVLVVTLGTVFRYYNQNQSWISALFLIVDRPLLNVLYFCLVIGNINIEGGSRRFFNWSGWRILARVSLPMMLCHWPVSMAIIGRSHAFHTSVFDVSVDYLATLFYGYLVSIPVALFVEIPFQRFFAQLF